jgi:hypothetical protein
MGNPPSEMDDYIFKQRKLHESQESQKYLREQNLSLLLQLNQKDQLLQRHKVSVSILFFYDNYSFFLIVEDVFDLILLFWISLKRI